MSAERNPLPTASETLIEAMEAFGECEPETVLILYTNQAGDLVWKSNTDSISAKLGMMRFAEAVMVRNQLESGK